MTAADLILRLGVNAVACLVAFVHVAFVMVIPKAACGAGAGGDPFVATAITGAVTLPLLLLMGIARSHLHYFRWLVVLPMALAIFAVLVVLPYLGGTTFGGSGLCSVKLGSGEMAASTLERLWAPFQLAVAGMVLWRMSKAFGPRAEAG